MKAAISARRMLARVGGPHWFQATPKRIDELGDDERLRVTRFAAWVDDRGVDGETWNLELYGFGSSHPLACQKIAMPTTPVDQPAALDRALCALSFVRWGAVMPGGDGTRIEGCCVQDFAERSIA